MQAQDAPNISLLLENLSPLLWLVRKIFIQGSLKKFSNSCNLNLKKKKSGNFVHLVKNIYWVLYYLFIYFYLTTVQNRTYEGFNWNVHGNSFILFGLWYSFGLGFCYFHRAQPHKFFFIIKDYFFSPFHLRMTQIFFWSCLTQVWTLHFSHESCHLDFHVVHIMVDCYQQKPELLHE